MSRIKIIAKAKRKTQIVLSAHWIEQSGRTTVNMELMTSGVQNEHTNTKSTMFPLCHINVNSCKFRWPRALRKIGSAIWSRASNTNARLLHKQVKWSNSLIHHMKMSVWRGMAQCPGNYEECIAIFFFFFSFA